MTGPRAAGESATISVLDDRFEPENELSKHVADKELARWEKLKPTRHWMVVQDSKFASGLIQVDMQPGEDRKLPIEMRPGCRVTLLVDDRVPVDAIIFRDPATGCTHRVVRNHWDRFFALSGAGGKELVFAPQRHTLYLGQGKYEFGVERGKVITMTEAVLDAPTQRVQLK